MKIATKIDRNKAEILANTQKTVTLNKEESSGGNGSGKKKKKCC